MYISSLITDRTSLIIFFFFFLFFFLFLFSSSRNRLHISGVPRNFVRFGGGGATNSVEGRENGDLGGGSPLVRDSAQFTNE
jgi:hypothetical protein